MSKKTAQLERIRDLPDGELAAARDRATDELFRLKLGLYTNQVENPISVRDKRREVARISAIIRGRQLGYEKQQAAASGKDE